MTKTALITGASSGIGEAFARRFARDGTNLVLVARRVDRLETLAEELRQQHGSTVTVIAADLSLPDAPRAVWAETERLNIAVDILVNNAGFGTHDEVLNSDPDLLDEEVRVNVGAVVALTSRYLPGMVTRSSGTVINIGSTASFQPVPHMAVYAASKAFVLSFTEALWGELQDTKVRAMALCPGATTTEFFDVAGEAARTGRPRTADALVDHALAALEQGKPSTVHGFENALVARVLTRLFLRRTMIRIAHRAATRNQTTSATRSRLRRPTEGQQP
jgi:short-subunit dehydrogenase